MVQRPATRAAAVAALLFPHFQPSLAQKSINPVCNTDALTALSALYINTNGPYWDGNGNNLSIGPNIENINSFIKQILN